MIDKSRYVVLDVETNGLSSEKDDLLSISIYKPDTNESIDRFLPLELQSSILTTEINGITKKDLKGRAPLSQKEFDDIINSFELDKRTILTYGDLDKRFIKRYLLRHRIIGFEKLSFKNIKDYIISSAWTNGALTKDNICKAIGIKGVSNVHSGHNDCILEWKLFEKMDGKKLFVAYSYDFCPKGQKHRSGNWYIYEFSDDYYVPVSYLHSHPKIIKFLSLPNVEIETKEIFRHTFSNKCSPAYAFQPAGVASEHLVKSMLGAKALDNLDYLIENKKKLRYLGSIEAEEIETIPFMENPDGTIKAVNENDNPFIDALNRQTEAIKKEIKPLIDFIKKTVFKEDEIVSQELIINEKYKLLGLCDFSNRSACLEAKWVSSSDKRRYDEYKYQLYITSNGRPCYIMVGSNNEVSISKVSFTIK